MEINIQGANVAGKREKNRNPRTGTETGTEMHEPELEPIFPIPTLFRIFSPFLDY